MAEGSAVGASDSLVPDKEAEVENASGSEVEMEDGVCPACLQRFGEQDKEWVLLNIVW